MHYSIFLDFERTHTKSHFKLVRSILSSVEFALEKKKCLVTWSKDPILENFVLVHIYVDKKLSNSCLSLIADKLIEKFDIPKCNIVEYSTPSYRLNYDLEATISTLNKKYFELDDESQIIMQSVVDLYIYLSREFSIDTLEQALKHTIMKLSSYNNPDMVIQNFGELKEIYTKNRRELINLLSPNLDHFKLEQVEETKDSLDKSSYHCCFNDINRILLSMPFDPRYNLYVIYTLWALIKEVLPLSNTTKVNNDRIRSV